MSGRKDICLETEIHIWILCRRSDTPLLRPCHWPCLIFVDVDGLTQQGRLSLRYDPDRASKHVGGADCPSEFHENQIWNSIPSSQQLPELSAKLTTYLDTKKSQQIQGNWNNPLHPIRTTRDQSWIPTTETTESLQVHEHWTTQCWMESGWRWIVRNKLEPL